MMNDTPRSEDAGVEASRSVLVDVLTALSGDLQAIAIIGSWIPELVFPDQGHIGSLDVDLVLDGRLIRLAARGKSPLDSSAWIEYIGG
jgi:hypothetical protein